MRLIDDVRRCLHPGYGYTAREIACMTARPRWLVCFVLLYLIRKGEAEKGADLSICPTGTAFIRRDIEVFKRVER